MRLVFGFAFDAIFSLSCLIKQNKAFIYTPSYATMFSCLYRIKLFRMLNCKFKLVFDAAPQNTAMQIVFNENTLFMYMCALHLSITKRKKCTPKKKKSFEICVFFNVQTTIVRLWDSDPLSISDCLRFYSEPYQPVLTISNQKRAPTRLSLTYDGR